MANRVNNLKDKRFGRLIVLNLYSCDKRAIWRCLCDCGEITLVAGNNLASGSTLSCGCLRIERIKNSNTTHGNTVNGVISPSYYSHKSMLQRCYNKNHPAYFRYGGRGITVCERWSTFENFLEDMGDRPEGRELDRIDNSKGYEKSNCKWSTKREQGYNKRNNVLITANSETLSVGEWAHRTGMPYTTLWCRLKNGWSHDDIINKPVRKRA